MSSFQVLTNAVPLPYLMLALLMVAGFITASFGLRAQKKLHPEEFTGATDRHWKGQVIFVLIFTFIFGSLGIRFFGGPTHRSNDFAQYVAESVDGRPHESSDSSPSRGRNAPSDGAVWRELESYRVTVQGLGSLFISHQCDQLTQVGPCIGVDRLVLKDASRQEHVLKTSTVTDASQALVLRPVTAVGSKLVIPYGVDACSGSGVPCIDPKKASVSDSVSAYVLEDVSAGLTPIQHFPAMALGLNAQDVYWNPSFTKALLVPHECHNKKACYTNPATYDFVNDRQTPVQANPPADSSWQSMTDSDLIWSDELVDGQASFWAFDDTKRGKSPWTDVTHITFNQYHLKNPRVPSKQFVEVYKKQVMLEL